MSVKVTPKLAEVVQSVTDDHKRQKLLELLNTLFAPSIENIQIVPKADKQRVFLTLKNSHPLKIGATDLTLPTKIYFDVLKEGYLEFYQELSSPAELNSDGCYFWNVVTVDNEAYLFEKNGVSFEFSAPLEKRIDSKTLLQALGKK